jgi:hypothetical protein
MLGLSVSPLYSTFVGVVAALVWLEFLVSSFSEPSSRACGVVDCTCSIFSSLLVFALFSCCDRFEFKGLWVGMTLSLPGCVYHGKVCCYLKTMIGNIPLL